MPACGSRPTTPRSARPASTVWVADQPTMRLADDTEVTMRLTAVAVEQDGRLVIQQLHVSVGVPNEEVLDQTLTV